MWIEVSEDQLATIREALESFKADIFDIRQRYPKARHTDIVDRIDAVLAALANTIPDEMTEEQFDAYLVQSGTLNKLVADATTTSPCNDWEAELDALATGQAQPAGVEVLDAPDGPGWWACHDAEGKNADIGQVYHSEAFGGYVFDASRGRYFVSNKEGKWYRLAMPWDSQRPPRVEGE